MSLRDDAEVLAQSKERGREQEQEHAGSLLPGYTVTHGNVLLGDGVVLDGRV